MKMRIMKCMTVLTMVLAVSVPAAAEELRAVASNLAGQVEIMPASAEAWAPLKNHQQVLVGDKVRTGADASAILTFDSGNVISLSALTSITVSELSRNGSAKKSVIDVDKGRLLAYARKLKNSNSEFAVRTPYAYAGVRGSEVVATVTDSSSLFQVLSGAFDVVVGEVSAILEAGYQMDILSSMTAPPSPMAIDSSALQSLKKEASEKKSAGKDADALNQAEMNTVQEMTDMIDMIDRANHGSCYAYCSSYYGSECYFYMHCPSSY